MASTCEGSAAVEKGIKGMRIDRLMLSEYKNLINFEVDFDETSSRQVVVGRNGVGKSNLLEALTRIFRDVKISRKTHSSAMRLNTNAIGIL